MKAFHLFAALVALAASPLEAGERIAVHVSPRIAFAPATVLVRTTVEKNEDNRAMEVVVDGGEYYRSSRVQLDGDSAPRSTTIELRDVPGGMYVVRATLVGRDGRPHNTVQEEVQILSR